MTKVRFYCATQPPKITGIDPDEECLSFHALTDKGDYVTFEAEVEEEDLVDVLDELFDKNSVPEHLRRFIRVFRINDGKEIFHSFYART